MRTLIMLTIVTASLQAIGGEWKQLPPLPDREGFAGCFAGVSHGALLVAGGANFPGKRLWDGGKKVWYDTVFVLDQPAGKWKTAGKLPRPLGYGVSVTHGDGVVCIGGSNAEGHYADVFRLEWKNGQLVTTTLPPLPKTVANACGAIVDGVLYVAGGLETADAKATLAAAWRMNLSAPQPRWEEVEPCPAGGRMLAVAAAHDGAFWLIGGVDLIATEDGGIDRRYLISAYRYTPNDAWQRLADLPHPVVAAPSPAPCDDRGVYLLGGDDGSHFTSAPQQHPGFSRQVLRYVGASRSWEADGELPAPRVTAPTALWNGRWIVASGEMRPSIRSPEVWAFQPQGEK